MTDLISRADAIAYIDRIINSGLGRNKSLDYIHKYISLLPSADAVSREFYEDAVKANIGLVIKNRELKEQIESADAVQEWIPCSERLPSEIGTIIVTLLDKKYGECFVDDEWWDGDMFLNFGKPTSGYEVIAWMPYPMPYRKGDER